MNRLVKNLADGLNVSLQERATNIHSTQHQVTVATNQGNEYASDAMILTAPVPQAFQLLTKSELTLSDEITHVLDQSSFKPCFVVLLTLKEPLLIGKAGIVSEGLPEEIDKIIANDQKGISTTPILSVYMTGNWSEDRFDLDDQNVWHEISSTILNQVIDPENISTHQLKRWRYAEALHVYNQPFLQIDQHPIYLAGDSFLTPEDQSGRTRIESAIHSGIRVAEHFKSK